MADKENLSILCEHWSQRRRERFVLLYAVGWLVASADIRDRTSHLCYLTVKFLYPRL